MAFSFFGGPGCKIAIREIRKSGLEKLALFVGMEANDKLL